MSLINDIIESWADIDGNVNTTEELLAWIEDMNKSVTSTVRECSILDSDFWFYDDYNGEILNRKRSFFSITGMRRFEDGELICEQPIIIQPEIGYLGIICRKIDGKINFLMQAKTEPGNINCVQISPTIQATKSNFMRAHGGKLPHYFDIFENSDLYEVIYDQIQSEQGMRFYKKRNRNMIVQIDKDIEVFENFRWMTLGQIKKLMEYDNLVNMDTRTVLAGLPIVFYEHCQSIKKYFTDEFFYNSIYNDKTAKNISKVFHIINDYKMFSNVRTTSLPLNELMDWKIDEFGVICRKPADFMVRYYDIAISGREVKKWTQPLFKAIGMAVFGLITKKVDGMTEYLIRVYSELGVFDKIEVGPSVLWKPTHYLYDDDPVEKVFRKHIEENRGVITNVTLSEEGGRFFHEQNKNYIIEIEDNEIDLLPDGYAWVDYGTLNHLIMFNNYVNIQLRNLIALLKL